MKNREIVRAKMLISLSIVLLLAIAIFEKPGVVFAATHNVAVVDVTPESDWLYRGKLCRANVNVTVANEGDVPETFNVTVFADSNTTVIGDEYVVGVQKVSLSNGTSATLVFPWDTTGVTPCQNYTLTAVADEVPNETDIADNTRSSSTSVRVRLLGDVNDDGEVNIRDLSAMVRAFGSYLGRPRWDVAADVNNDGWVDIRDLVLVAKNFGNVCP